MFSQTKTIPVALTSTGNNPQKKDKKTKNIQILDENAQGKNLTEDNEIDDEIKEMVINNKISELYKLISSTTSDVQKDYLEKHKFLELPMEHRLVNHPKNFSPISYIQNFLSAEGDMVWTDIKTKNYASLLQRAQHERIELLHHPVNGNTIFHEDISLINFYKRYDINILDRPNWNGDRINLNIETLLNHPLK